MNKRGNYKSFSNYYIITPMKFVIFHGAFGNPDEQWFPELKEKLEILGQKVLSPQFPVENWQEITNAGPSTTAQRQNLYNWLTTFEMEVIPFLGKDYKACFIGHSLSPVFILHAVAKFNIQLDSAIFVSPFLTALKSKEFWQFDLVNGSFYKDDFDWDRLRKLIPVSYVLYSDNDPYVNKNYSLEFSSKMGSSTIEVKRAGHMNAEMNLNEFPLVFELCKSRLDLSLYQKYLAHRRELFSVDYEKGKTEEIIYLTPKEVFDEGVFHFRNLKKSGFCTLYTGSTFWDTQSLYMKEARKAAKRTKNLTRVYLVENMKDLERKGLLEQLKLDISSDTKVYFCMLKDVKDKLPETDFSIWDDDYTCFVRFDKGKKATEVILTSRKIDLKAAENWKKEILKHAVRIDDLDDIASFISKYLGANSF